MASGGLLRLGDKVDGAKSESFKSGVGTLLGVGAKKNDGHGSTTHDEAESFHAVHARHFQIEGDNVGAQLLDFFQSESAVHCRAHDFDGRIAGEHSGNQLPHQSGIINDKNADAAALAHAIAPSGATRERRERMAGTLRMRTTVPSPRMEAPLTRSLETMSLGSALMTSSSSPTMLSTTSPKRFSAEPITMTKCFCFAGS